MVYFILRNYCLFVLKFFFLKQIDIYNKAVIPKKGPIFFASVHPNSFLDAIILCSYISKPLWSLARGDAFKKPWLKKFLHQCCMMPIYRLSEGKENLHKNDETFEACNEIFKKEGQVLIFAEGLCTNQTEVLPLKKGPARLSKQLRDENLDIKIIPVGLSYNSYSSYGKHVQVRFGDELSSTLVGLDDGFYIKKFSQNLSDALKNLSFKPLGKLKIFSSLRFYFFSFLILPISVPLYFITKKMTKNTVFFDSVFFLSLVIFLPVYLLISAILVFIF